MTPAPPLPPTNEPPEAYPGLAADRLLVDLRIRPRIMDRGAESSVENSPVRLYPYELEILATEIRRLRSSM